VLSLACLGITKPPGLFIKNHIIFIQYSQQRPLSLNSKPYNGEFSGGDSLPHLR